MAGTVRSIRNNNPGNIRVGDPWRGLAAPQEMTPAQKAETAFCVFVAAKWGFRAMAVILMNYQDRHDLGSVGAMIDRWAPPAENDTAAYVARVCRDLGVGRDEPVDVQDWRVMRPLVEAIARVESGGAFPWAEAEVEEGLKLAGIVKPQGAAVRDPGLVAGAGLTVVGVATVVEEALRLLEGAEPLVQAVGDSPMLGIGLAAAVAGMVAWRLLARRRQVEG